MPEPGSQYVAARRALLDALSALSAHLNALVIVGAQAIYTHTGDTDEAVAALTGDGDIAIDPDLIADQPLLEVALRESGFELNERGNPGEWRNAVGVEVDLLVPEAVAPGRGSRSVEIPPHSSRSARRVTGLEGALVDHGLRRIEAFEADDDRVREVRVAGPAALLVSKLHKIHERLGAKATRRKPKDSHDVYRLLRDVDPETMRAGMEKLLATDLSRASTLTALEYLRALFGSPQSPGAAQAAESIRFLGDESEVAEGSSLLASELLDAVGPPV